jgi:hypothetical protein
MNLVPNNSSHVHLVSPRTQVEAKGSYRAGYLRHTSEDREGGTSAEPLQRQAIFDPSSRHSGTRTYVGSQCQVAQHRMTAPTSIVNRQNVNRATLIGSSAIIISSHVAAGTGEGLYKIDRIASIDPPFSLSCLSRSRAFPLHSQRQSSANFPQSPLGHTVEEYDDGERDVESRHRSSA